MARELRIALAQMNCLVGDIPGNVDHISSYTARARDQLQAQVVVFPELAITGYPPEDLLLRPEFLDRSAEALEQLRREAAGIDVIVGHPHVWRGQLYNAASVLREGEIVHTYHKQLLPNYSVFDEKRYFASGRQACVFDVQGVPVGLTICEDVWGPQPVARAARAGASLVINLNASPFHMDKYRSREEITQQRAHDNEVPMVYLNMVGGQDELVFDGASFVMGSDGAITQRAPAFTEDLYLARFDVEQARVRPRPGEVTPIDLEASVYQALVTGVHDYVTKNGFSGTIIGLSGGIDSALTLAIAVDALGADRVQAVMMPSQYTASISLDDARAEAQALGVRYSEILIGPIVEQVERSLADEFTGLDIDSTEENIQARARGLLLMAISNKKGSIVLTTGNKTEMAVGYATLYGDMAGGFAVIKDVPKMWVYRLSRYRNRIAPVIPERVLTRAPSAELRADQKDQDSLPPYDQLDLIVEMYVEEDHSIDDIVAATAFDAAVVQQVIHMINRSEYKRRQAPPGVRISNRAFGRDRRYPITSGFRHGSQPRQRPAPKRAVGD